MKINVLIWKELEIINQRGAFFYVYSVKGSFKRDDNRRQTKNSCLPSIVLKDIFKDAFQEMLEAELELELGYSKGDRSNKKTNNRRNGHTEKTVKTQFEKWL